MARKVAACALMVVLLATWWPPAGAQAQANPKDTPIVVGEGAGSYVEAAAPSVVGAFDRTIGELDAVPMDVTPKQVKDASWRRRILELRLLMDLNAFAYDKARLKGYRDVVDRAYEASGVYQDVDVMEKELGAPISPDVTAARLVEMNDGLAPLRDPGSRNELRGFLASPLTAIRKGGGPRLWDITGDVASNGFDATGNAAMLQSGIVRHLQAADLGVNDIFDPSQAAALHLIRKQMREVVLLSAMYPDINGNTRDAVRPLVDLVNDYGDLLDAYVSYEFAQQAGMDTSKVQAEVQREFDVSQQAKNQFIDTHALDAMAIKLNEVRDAHRR